MRMDALRNIPLFLILLPLMSAALCLALPERMARRLTAAVACLECAGMGALIVYCQRQGKSFVYAMGAIGAPFGNELRVGVLEALVGLCFSLVLLLAQVGGWKTLTRDISPNRRPLYCAVTCLLTAAMAAMTFTNDLFTAYVFIEITTIAACALICASNHGHTLFAGARYMIMNLLGSGLFLLGLSMLYCLTGQLLFPQLGEGVRALLEDGRYAAPLYLSFLLMTMGIAVKSALYPFHTWLPSAYGSATATSSAILSSLISKMYIFLLIKILLRAAGAEAFTRRLEDVLLLYAAAGVIMGSVHAMRQHTLSRMTAYSSVAHIGYIFLGISLGTQAGMAAAVFHMLAHSMAKSCLFLTVHRFKAVSGESDSFSALRGAAKRAPLAGCAYLIAAGSLVGIPLLGGFNGKLFLCQAGVSLGGWRMNALLGVLALSTVLNAAYLFKMALLLFGPEGEQEEKPASPPNAPYALAAVALTLLTLALGAAGEAVMALIEQGMAMFA